jgi:hypothetical protein
MSNNQEVKTRESRRFLGIFPPKTNFDKAHLKAYIQGHKQFFYKAKDKFGNKIPFTVEQEYYNKPIEN